jgi:hypothetical protein
MKTFKAWASLLALTLSCNVLMAGTYYLQSMGGTDGPPYPFNPNPDAPTTQVGSDTYLVDDTETMDTGAMMFSGFTMSAAALDPSDPGTNNPDGPDGPTKPNIRNYAKYGAQIFQVLDTNSVLNEIGDTNLYNACAVINGPTNGLPWLTIKPFGEAGVIIRADNFDYSQTNAPLALLVCDKVETRTWKAIDFGGASDAQDGWLVQGTVSQPQSTMFFQVTNLNMTYPAFFKVIPYNGPQVVIAGTNQPFDIVSNIISLTAQIYDLTGTTNEGFIVDVNGDNISTHASLSNNTITLDTKYNPNGQDYGIDNVDLTVKGLASVYSYNDLTVFTNTPVDMKTVFTSAASIPLDFENVNYLLFQSSLCPRDVGTNGILFVCKKEEDVTATITDPRNNQIVASYGGHVVGPVMVEIDWNFTEADGVTPYSNTTYLVHFTASDPDDFQFPNFIDEGGAVRRGTGCFITYESEPPFFTEGQYTDMEQSDWLDGTLVLLYKLIYGGNFVTDYTTDDIGPDRQYVDSQGLKPGNNGQWVNFMEPAMTNSFLDDLNLPVPKYSDLTIGGAHGNGRIIGGNPGHLIQWLPDQFSPADLQSWLQEVGPRWRLRKAALWSCLSGQTPGINTNEMDWMDGCGIRGLQIQRRSYCDKNAAWVLDGLLPTRLGGPTSVDSMAHVACAADQLWVAGPNDDGIGDPTYASGWVWITMRGLYPDDLGNTKVADFDQRGYIYLPYTTIYDSEIKLLDHSHIKHPGVN